MICPGHPNFAAKYSGSALWRIGPCFLGARCFAPLSWTVARTRNAALSIMYTQSLDSRMRWK